MSEELRLLFRNALYIGSAVGVYWFVSYEWAGTIMMMVLGIGALAFVTIAAKLTRAASKEDILEEGESGTRGNWMLSLPQRTVGFDEEPQSRIRKAPLEIAESEMPHGSIWPFVCVVGIVLTCLGFIFGIWFWVIGGGIVVWAMWGWVTQLLPPTPTIEAEHPATRPEVTTTVPEEPGPDGAKPAERVATETSGDRSTVPGS